MFANISVDFGDVIVVITEFEYTPEEKPSKYSDGEGEYTCPLAGYAFEKESGKEISFDRYKDCIELDNAIKNYMRR